MALRDGAGGMDKWMDPPSPHNDEEVSARTGEASARLGGGEEEKTYRKSGTAIQSSSSSSSLLRRGGGHEKEGEGS